MGYKIDIHRFKHNGEWKKSVTHHIGIAYEENDWFNEEGILKSVHYGDGRMKGVLYTAKNGWSEVSLRVLEKNHKERFEKLKIRHNLN